MLKRLFAFMFALLFVLSFTACKKESDQQSEDTTVSEVTADTAAAETTAAPETEAPAKDKYTYIDFYEDNGGGHNPYSLMAADSSIGVHFKVAEGFLEDFSICCPSWSNDIGSLTMRVYKWNTDYASTVAGTPAAEETFVDYADNDWLIMYFNADGAKGLEAGEYLVTLGDGVDESGSGVGLWTYGPIADPAIINYYANGEVTDQYGWEAAATIVIPA